MKIKSMKKSTRIICALLAIVLVVGVALPAGPGRRHPPA